MIVRGMNRKIIILVVLMLFLGTTSAIGLAMFSDPINKIISNSSNGTENGENNNSSDITTAQSSGDGGSSVGRYSSVDIHTIANINTNIMPSTSAEKCSYACTANFLSNVLMRNQYFNNSSAAITITVLDDMRELQDNDIVMLKSSILEDANYTKGKLNSEKLMVYRGLYIDNHGDRYVELYTGGDTSYILYNQFQQTFTGIVVEHDNCGMSNADIVQGTHSSQVKSATQTVYDTTGKVIDANYQKGQGILKTMYASMAIFSGEIVASSLDAIGHGMQFVAVPGTNSGSLSHATASAIRVAANIAALGVEVDASITYSSGLEGELFYQRLLEIYRLLKDDIIDLRLVNAGVIIPYFSSPPVPNCALNASSTNIKVGNVSVNSSTNNTIFNITSDSDISAGLYSHNNSLVPVPYTLEFELYEKPNTDMNNNGNCNETLSRIRMRGYPRTCVLNTNMWFKEVDGIAISKNGEYGLKITDPDHPNIPPVYCTINFNRSTDSSRNNNTTTGVNPSIVKIEENNKVGDHSSWHYNNSTNTWTSWMGDVKDEENNRCYAYVVDAATGNVIDSNPSIVFELWEKPGRDDNHNSVTGERLYSTKDYGTDINRDGHYVWANFATWFWASENKLTVLRSYNGDFDYDPYTKDLHGKYPQSGLSTYSNYDVKIKFSGDSCYQPSEKVITVQIIDSRYDSSLDMAMDGKKGYNATNNTYCISKGCTDDKYNLAAKYMIFKRDSKNPHWEKDQDNVMFAQIWEYGDQNGNGIPNEFLFRELDGTNSGGANFQQDMYEVNVAKWFSRNELRNISSGRFYIKLYFPGKDDTIMREKTINMFLLP